MTVRKGAHFLI